MIDYFNRYRVRKQEEPQTVELNENGRVKYTLEFITELAEDEVFIFSSDFAGMHGGGAAATAHRCFGTVWGKGVGLYLSRAMLSQRCREFAEAIDVKNIVMPRDFVVIIRLR